jgi:hypothetical protein
LKKNLIIITFLLVFILPTPVFASTKAVKSDIKAYVDYTPINSYNIEGYTYIIAEELINYGFEVLWNNETRSLNINRVKLSTPLYTIELWNDSLDSIGKIYDIYPTDIKCFLDGRMVNSFNIGGKTVIQFDELEKYGGFSWDADSRIVSATIFQNELKNALDSIENKVVIDNSTGYSTDRYTGQVDENNIPNGIGLLEVSDAAPSAGVTYMMREEILGHFKDGNPANKIFSKRHFIAGRTGENIEIYFIGNVNNEKRAERSYDFDSATGSVSNIVRTPNFGLLALPHFYMKSYVGTEFFPDVKMYESGAWFEHNRFRGQRGVTYGTWFNGIDYQTTIETKVSDFQGIQIATHFTEYINNALTNELVK